MGEIMNSSKGVKSCVPERVSISYSICGTHHDSHKNNLETSHMSQLVNTPSTYVTVSQKFQICEQLRAV